MISLHETDVKNFACTFFNKEKNILDVCVKQFRKQFFQNQSAFKQTET